MEALVTNGTRNIDITVRDADAIALNGGIKSFEPLQLLGVVDTVVNREALLPLGPKDNGAGVSSIGDEDLVVANNGHEGGGARVSHTLFLLDLLVSLQVGVVEAGAHILGLLFLPLLFENRLEVIAKPLGATAATVPIEHADEEVPQIVLEIVLDVDHVLHVVAPALQLPLLDFHAMWVRLHRVEEPLVIHVVTVTVLSKPLPGRATPLVNGDDVHHLAEEGGAAECDPLL